jgi:hypothetical protein
MREYERDDLASDSEDEKRLRSAENMALRSIKDKKRPHPYSKSVPSATVFMPCATVTTPEPTFRGVGYQQPPFRSSRKRQATPYDICYNCNQRRKIKVYRAASTVGKLRITFKLS